MQILNHMPSGLISLTDDSLTQKRKPQMSNILQNTHANLTQVDYNCQMEK